MFHGHLNYFQKLFLGGRLNTKFGRPCMALQNLTTIESVYFIMCEDPIWIEIHWNSIWLKAQSHMTSRYTWGPATTLYDLKGVLGRPLHTSFGLSQFHFHGSWLVCEVALRLELTGLRIQKIPSSSVYLLGPFWGNPKRRVCSCLYPAHGNL